MWTRWLRQMMNYTLTVTNGGGDFTITPSISTTRLVDSSQSPAFGMIEEIAWCFNDIVMEGIPAGSVFSYELNLIVSSIVTLKQRLVECFRIGAASPYDVDIAGNNLLHVTYSRVSQFLCSRSLTCVQSAFEALGQTIETLVRFSAVQNVVNEAMDPMMEVILLLAAVGMNETGRDDSSRVPLDIFLECLFSRGKEGFERFGLETRFHQLIKCKDFTVSTTLKGGCLTFPAYKYIYTQFPGTAECKCLCF